MDKVSQFQKLNVSIFCNNGIRKKKRQYKISMKKTREENRKKIEKWSIVLY